MAAKTLIAMIDDEIAKLKQIRSLLTGIGSTAISRSARSAIATSAKKRTKRNLSPEGRKRIAEAQKRRWAARLTAQQTSQKSAQKTGKR